MIISSHYSVNHTKLILYDLQNNSVLKKKLMMADAIIFPRTMFNKTFYKFLMSFVAVVAGTLFFILIVGLGV
jgi:hypothetical protein